MKFCKKKFDLGIDILIKKSISRFKKTGKNIEKPEKKLEKLAENANLPRIPITTRGFLLKPSTLLPAFAKAASNASPL